MDSWTSRGWEPKIATLLMYIDVNIREPASTRHESIHATSHRRIPESIVRQASRRVGIRRRGHATAEQVRPLAMPEKPSRPNTLSLRANSIVHVFVYLVVLPKQRQGPIWLPWPWLAPSRGIGIAFSAQNRSRQGWKYRNIKSLIKENLTWPSCRNGAAVEQVAKDCSCFWRHMGLRSSS